MYMYLKLGSTCYRVEVDIKMSSKQRKIDSEGRQSDTNIGSSQRQIEDQTTKGKEFDSGSYCV